MDDIIPSVPSGLLSKYFIPQMDDIIPSVPSGL